MRKNMQQMEKEIEDDLTELQDQMSQYVFLIECGMELPKYPEQYRTEENLIRECQVKTWIYTKFEEGRLRFYADSEALIIRGALSLLAEIYSGRSREEVERFHCTLVKKEFFRIHYTQEQMDGLLAILRKLENGN